MWTAFPSSDYYGRSATRPPHRRGFSRLAAAYPCDLPTRPGFPGSLAGTRTLPVRPRPFCTQQRSAAPPGIGGQSGRAADLGPLAGPPGRFTEKHGIRPPGPFPIPGSLRPDGSRVGGNGGCVSRRYWPISLSWSCGSSTWRKSLGYGSLACFPLCPGSSFADGFARPVNLPRRYGSLPSGYGSDEHCRQGGLSAA